MERAVRLAKIQESIEDKAKGKLAKQLGNSKNYTLGQKVEIKFQFPNGQLSKERQLRDYY
jgi:hypothetical protein